MKVIFVTANLPFGTDEAFIVPEINQLIRAGDEVLIVPRSPKGRVIHGKDLSQYTRCEPLCSPAILTFHENREQIAGTIAASVTIGSKKQNAWGGSEKSGGNS